MQIPVQLEIAYWQSVPVSSSRSSLSSEVDILKYSFQILSVNLFLYTRRKNSIL